VLTGSITIQRLEPIAGWDAKVIEHRRRSHLA